MKRTSTFTLIIILINFITVKAILATDFFSIDEIRKELVSHLKIAESAVDRDITVFIGNTGVGKSTLIDSLAGFPLTINTRGKIILDGNHPHASPIGAGTSSVTHCPQHFSSDKIGHMYDLPGFLDTGGTVKNILNAASIYNLLTKARSARVIFVTSYGELEEASRGALSREFDKAVAMFEDKFLRSNSCLSIVNCVEREIVDKDPQDNNILNLLENLNNIGKTQKSLLLKKARITDGQPFLNELKTTLLPAVLSLNQRPIKNLNMTYTFNHEASNHITEFFKDCMKKHQDTISENLIKDAVDDITQNIELQKIEGPISKVLKTYYSKVWKQFKDDFKLTQEFALLNQICAAQYSKALDNFEISFSYDFESAVSQFTIREQENIAESAQQAMRAAKLKEEEASKSARIAQQQASQYEKEKNNAQEQAKTAKQAAKAAQADAMKSRQEKDKAQRDAEQASEQFQKVKTEFDDFRRAYEEKLNLLEKERHNLKKFAEDAQKKSEELTNAYKKRDEEMQEIMSRMEKEYAELTEKISELNKNNDQQTQEFKNQMNEMKLNHERSMREMAERHNRELANRSNNGGGGKRGCTIL